LQIDFTASSSESIIEITDLRGNLVNQFIFESNTNNQNHLIWNLTYENGTRVPAGVYFVKLSSGEKVKVEKVIIH
jgi:flagellar hook assembly protein FlgD